MKRSDTRAALGGFLWGLAEGTFFFIVPDVLLCYWAMRSARQAVAATVGVIAGALLAAGAIYGLAHGVGIDRASHSLHALWSALPGFRPRMAEVAEAHLRAAGEVGLLSGPASGIPYRVYVLEAARLDLSLWKILLWTPIARLERIVIAPAVVLALRWLCENLLARRFARVTRRQWRAALAAGIVLYWIGLYVWYWGRLVPGLYGAA